MMINGRAIAFNFQAIGMYGDLSPYNGSESF